MGRQATNVSTWKNQRMHHVGIGRDDPSFIARLCAVVEQGSVEPECGSEDFANKPVGEASATSMRESHTLRGIDRHLAGIHDKAGSSGFLEYRK